MAHRSQQIPNQDEGWEYFKKFTNPRWKIDDTTKAVRPSHKKKIALHRRRSQVRHRLSVADEGGSEPVPLWSSTLEDMGMFGIGIGMYFKQIVGFFWLSVIYGLILIPAMHFYASTNYNNIDSIPFLLRGSAVCTRYENVTITEDCEPSTSESHCTGLYAPDCYLDGNYGFYDFSAMFLLVLFLLYMRRLQKLLIVELDEEEQTPQDYSVVVFDPDPDAECPEEWEQFFNQFGEVAYVTITRKNRKLLRALTERRDILHEMYDEGIISKETPPRSESSSLLQPEKPTLFEGKTKRYWEYQLYQVNKKIEALSKKKYPVDKVYVIFSEEAGQRNCLNYLSTGGIPSMLNMSFLQHELRFRGRNVLDVAEPVEPSEVIWHNLELSWTYLFIQGVVSACVNFVLIYGCYLIIDECKEENGANASIELGLCVTALNILFPQVLKLLVRLENHVEYGDQQDSLYFKLTVFRIMNTAIINYVTTNFHYTLSKQSLRNIACILLADAFVVPTVQLLDIPGKIKRRVIARFAKTHDGYLNYFTGSPWFLGERYTLLTKTFFVSIFYAALFPAGMFIAAFAFAYMYWVDKFLLLRVWKKPPHYDAKLAGQARSNIMFAVLCHLLVTANWYYGWPFDNTHPTSGGYKAVNKRVFYRRQPETWYKFFFMTPQTWQSDSQQLLVEIYGRGAVILLCCLVLIYFSQNIYLTLKRWFVGHYEPVGEEQGISFQNVEKAEAYVPMCFPTKNELAGPLVAAHCMNLHERHLPDLRGKTLKERNVAEEFNLTDQRRLFGIVRGVNTTAKNFNVDIEEQARVNTTTERIGIPQIVKMLNWMPSTDVQTNIA